MSEGNEISRRYKGPGDKTPYVPSWLEEPTPQPQPNERTQGDTEADIYAEDARLEGEHYQRELEAELPEQQPTPQPQAKVNSKEHYQQLLGAALARVEQLDAQLKAFDAAKPQPSPQPQGAERLDYAHEAQLLRDSRAKLLELREQDARTIAKLEQQRDELQRKLDESRHMMTRRNSELAQAEQQRDELLAALKFVLKYPDSIDGKLGWRKELEAKVARAEEDR